MSAANRANVTFYAIDARGLQIGGENSGALNELAGAATSSRSQAQSDGGAVRPDEVLAADRAEEGMRANVQMKLRDLSESTGGFLLANTNDLRTPLKRINEEINSFYEITYNPAIDNYDGRFRKISVKVAGDVKVSTRNGYFALPPTEAGNIPLQPYEVPLLKALGTSPLPKEVEYRMAAIRFQQTPDGVKGVLAIEVPLKSLTFQEDKAANTYAAHVSIVALIKNSKGEVVKKFDRDLPLKGELSTLPARKEANFLYKEQFTQPPGRYTVESAVLDREGNKIGARRSSFVVPTRPPGVTISSISLVRRFEPNAKDLDPEDPFQLQGGRVTPTLGSTIVGGKGALLSLFFVVYPDPAISEPPKAMVEFLMDGKQVGAGAVDLPKPDANGRIAYVMSSPAESMKPGTYEVHAVVKQGPTAMDDRTFVTIVAPSTP